VTSVAKVEFHPVTRDRWPDLERLFSASAGEELGNPSRCWCMEGRLASHAEWEASAGEPNKRAMQRLVESGEAPGILAYISSVPAGWCSVAPRPTHPGLRAAGTFRRFDDPGVWTVLCFFVPESRRGRGLMHGLLQAAVRYATERGARTIEGYPFEAAYADDGASGTIEGFARAGFAEAARISKHQALMRYHTRSS
jgi:GNAT superfamily N-acetyltransferase